VSSEIIEVWVDAWIIMMETKNEDNTKRL